MVQTADANLNGVYIQPKFRPDAFSREINLWNCSGGYLKPNWQAMCRLSWSTEERDPELTDDQIFIDDFLPRLTFSEEKRVPPVSISVEFETQDPAAGVAIVASLVDMANEVATTQAVTDQTNRS